MTEEIMTAIRARFNHVLAFEVSKAELVAYVVPTGDEFRVKNTPAAVRKLIKRQIAANAKLGIGPLLVVCEATGSYDANVLGCAAELGVACHRAHGSRVRAYAKFRGTHAKSDPIDCRLIGEFGRDSPVLHLYQPPRPAQAELRELVSRRTELREMLEAEQARLPHVHSKTVKASIAASARSLARQLETLEVAIAELIAHDEQFARAGALMRTVKGVGPIVVASVLAYLPEIGTVSKGTIAALAGLAPYDDDSGTHRGKRHIFAGRAEVRNALYMPAIVAMRHNTHLKALADRIIAGGKPFKVAATAVMRKLLVILNGIIASGKPCQMSNAT